ncbi:MAG: hypothetical protein LAN63_13020 [Acidobacteriia bacterium]|nr:hypothetical protein [Terriglobia bacterium]
MTYIAAFHCNGGLVMCADTLETFGDYKNYVEKIETADPFPLAIGGAGVSDIIEPVLQEVVDRFRSEKPSTRGDVKKLIQAALNEVFSKDVPLLVLKKQHRTAEFLIAAKPKDEGFCIFWAKGRRVYKEVRKGVIGYGTPYNNALLNRLHNDSLPMAQAVMLATYLVSQSKDIDEGVGGEPRVVIVTNTIFYDDPTHIGNVEARAREFVQLADEMFLSCADLSISTAALVEQLDNFRAKIVDLRQKHLQVTAEWVISHIDRYSAPYAYLPPGTVLTLSNSGVTYTEDEAEIEKFRESIRRAEDELKKLRDAFMQSTSRKSELEP